MTKLSRDIDNTIERLARSKPDIWMPSACGVTRSQRSIPALLHRDAHAPVASRARVLVVGGLSERLEDASLALEALRTFAQSDNGLPDRVALSAVPCVNFDSLIAGGGPGNGKGSDPAGDILQRTVSSMTPVARNRATCGVGHAFRRPT